ncbi:uncharacterized protein BcabD6B2_20050 [Babesia caballi]|uniref:Uncharacterized protein n=1 Tax=Babesia caballi TaxID=5871 RepID=A0AAV4LS11_BABCB|nr:hypothetical protein, conserved [Babesia caballi]
MTSQQKPLTEAPKNLKEAIDWVIQIKGHAQDLAKELKKLLKHDGSEVAMRVLESYRLASQSVIEKLTPQKEKFHFAVPHAILNKLGQGLDPFPSGSAAISREEAEKWVSKVQGNTSEMLIKDLAEGLKMFVDQPNGILQNPNISAYPETSMWPDSSADKKTCALIFLGIGPMLFYGLTYLYWWCESQGDWKRLQFQNSGSTNSLSAYLDAMGFKDSEFNEQKKQGSKIAEVLDKAFPELKNNANEPYPSYLSKLLKETVSTSTSLTSLYVLSYHFITHPLYIVESTSPATPSFLGYSAPAALAGGAYGFNLGGLGTFMGALLA